VLIKGILNSSGDNHIDEVDGCVLVIRDFTNEFTKMYPDLTNLKRFHDKIG